MGGERYNAASAESEESLYGSDPERPVGAADDGGYRYIGESAGTSPGLYVPGEDAIEALGGIPAHTAPSEPSHSTVMLLEESPSAVVMVRNVPFSPAAEDGRNSARPLSVPIHSAPSRSTASA